MVHRVSCAAKCTSRPAARNCVPSFSRLPLARFQRHPRNLALTEYTHILVTPLMEFRRLFTNPISWLKDAGRVG